MTVKTRATVTDVRTVFKETKINLALTPEQARTLVAVCEHVGGHPDTTRRGDTHEILQALLQAGIPSSVGFGSLDRDVTQGLTFTDEGRPEPLPADWSPTPKRKGIPEPRVRPLKKASQSVRPFSAGSAVVGNHGDGY